MGFKRVGFKRVGFERVGFERGVAHIMLARSSHSFCSTVDSQPGDATISPSRRAWVQRVAAWAQRVVTWVQRVAACLRVAALQGGAALQGVAVRLQLAPGRRRP